MITAESLITALERARVEPEEEIRIEMLASDDSCEQGLAVVERRISEGQHYVCIVVENA